MTRAQRIDRFGSSADRAFGPASSPPALVLVLAAAIGCPLRTSADAPIDFGRDIRPILARNCFTCHGPDADTRESGLRLDTRDGAVAEADSGLQAVVPGNAEQSELMARVAAPDDDVRMPPLEHGARLSDQEVQRLKQWIDEGARYAGHWSFEKPNRSAVPEVRNTAWVQNEIDRFVLSRLEKEGLTPSPQADRYTLVRRLSLDLIGLPPTLEEIDAFVRDDSPGAYERLVDRLLDSPRYGERWAAVWLDLARYADSQGYAQDTPRTIWRYRDWVIRAINDNMPFDQFTIEQIAGDLLPNATDDQLIATAFHRNTMTNSEGGTDDEEFRVAAVVDRVNTTMQVWMGLTVGCAQCHNHKYDPISQEEYYRLFAFFNQTEDADHPDERPTLASYGKEQEETRDELAKQIGVLEKQLAQTKAVDPPQLPTKSGPLRSQVVRIELPGPQKLLSLAEVQVLAGGTNVALGKKAAQSSVDYDGPPELAVDGNTDGHYFDAKSTTHTKLEDDPWWQVDLGEALTVDRIVVWNRTDSEAVGRRLDGFRIVLLDASLDPLWIHTVARAPATSATLNVPKAYESFSQTDRSALADYRRQTSPELQQVRDRLAELKRRLADIKPIATPIMRERPKDDRRATNILIRGNFLDKGKEVTAGVPAAFHPLPESAQRDRLALARWLVDRNNPLSARVTVNRYWQQLFGTGLVETSEDFGTQGQLPSHPELLDWLATELIKREWDAKALLKLMVTSATYRQSSRVTPELLEQDPFNRLLARGPRFRLSAETIRDQALAIAGLLSGKLFGPSVRPPRPTLGLRAAFGGSTDWETSPGDDKYRRGLYTMCRRTAPYPSLTTFDAPSREVCTIRRVRTNTPLQALVTLNDPVYIEASQSLARRMMSEGGSQPSDRAAHGFRLCLARPPGRQESERLVTLYQDALRHYRQAPEAAEAMAADPIGPVPAEMPAEELAAWTVVANVLLNLDETLMKK